MTDQHDDQTDEQQTDQNEQAEQQGRASKYDAVRADMVAAPDDWHLVADDLDRTAADKLARNIRSGNGRWRDAAAEVRTNKTGKGDAAFAVYARHLPPGPADVPAPTAQGAVVAESPAVVHTGHLPA